MLDLFLQVVSWLDDISSLERSINLDSEIWSRNLQKPDNISNPPVLSEYQPFSVDSKALVHNFVNSSSENISKSISLNTKTQTSIIDRGNNQQVRFPILSQYQHINEDSKVLLQPLINSLSEAASISVCSNIDTQSNSLERHDSQQDSYPVLSQNSSINEDNKALVQSLINQLSENTSKSTCPNTETQRHSLERQDSQQNSYPVLSQNPSINEDSKALVQSLINPLSNDICKSISNNSKTQCYSLEKPNYQQNSLPMLDYRSIYEENKLLMNHLVNSSGKDINRSSFHTTNTQRFNLEGDNSTERSLPVLSECQSIIEASMAPMQPSVGVSEDCKIQVLQPFRCDHCGHTASNWELLEQHVAMCHNRTHDVKQVVHCNSCSYFTFDQKSLSKHIATVHTTGPPDEGSNDPLLKCGRCRYTTRKIRLLNKHISLRHTSDEPFQCNQCSYSTLRSHLLRNHIANKHSAGGIAKFSCHYEGCNYTSSYKNNLKAHIIGIHDKARPFQCDQCDYRSAYPGSLKVHIKAVHRTEKPYKCEQCNYSTVVISTLKNHINNVHNKQKPFKCMMCDYCTSESSNLRRHVVNAHSKGSSIQRHWKPREKSLKCDFCPFFACMLSTVKHHAEREHGKEPAFECPHCPYTSLVQRALQLHVQRVHEKARLSCNQCNYTTLRQVYLEKHVKEHHSEDRVVLKCSECSFTARIPCRLKKHINDVHAEKRFRCDLCNYKSNQKFHFKQHLSTVHKMNTLEM